MQEEGPDTITLQCVPLYSLLLSLGNPTVNWFILDIEGAEYQVLQTIPWHSVDIEMISVETDMAGVVMPGTRQEIIDKLAEEWMQHKPRCQFITSDPTCYYTSDRFREWTSANGIGLLQAAGG